MSDVQFEDSNNTFKSRSVLGAPEVPGMANFLVKKGIVKEEGNAKFVLFATIVVCTILAILIPLFFAPKPIEVDKEKINAQMMGTDR